MRVILVVALHFRKSRSVGAWLGLTTRRYQSGEVDYDGHISRRGDTHLRGLLYEAATVVLTRTSAESSLRTWGLKLKERIGFKRAAVAVARKRAVVCTPCCGRPALRANCGGAAEASLDARRSLANAQLTSLPGRGPDYPA